MRRRLFAAGAVSAVILLAPGAMAVPKSAPPTSLGDLARPDWVDAAPVIVEPDEARRRVVACGLEAARVATRDDAALRETVLTVARGIALSDEQLACVATVSLDTDYRVMFDPDLAARYGAAYARLDKARAARK